jgi:hypothetical protein
MNVRCIGSVRVTAYAGNFSVAFLAGQKDPVTSFRKGTRFHLASFNVRASGINHARASLDKLIFQFRRNAVRADNHSFSREFGWNIIFVKNYNTAFLQAVYDGGIVD